MFAAESHTSRHHIAIAAMACLCFLLGGPSYAAGAESLIIAGATYYEPGVSGPGWAWTDGTVKILSQIDLAVSGPVLF